MFVKRKECIFFMEEIRTNVSGVTFDLKIIGGCNILTKSAQTLLAYFRTFPENKPITATQKELATATNLSRRTIQNALEQLEKLGEIRIVSNKTEGAQNLYFVNCAPETNVHLKAKLPESHIMPINRLANELQHDIINRGAFDLVVAGKGTENETTNYTCVTLDNTDGIKMSGKPYTEYDRQVHDAACSLFEYGHPSHIMTSEMVFRAMTHDTETKCPSPQQIGAVAKSMSKMNSIYITTDTTAEMKKLNIPLEEVLIEGHMLEFRTIYVKAGGKKVKAYQMIAEPLLLHYSKQTKQLATVSGELLAVKEVIKDESTGKIKRITDSVIANSEIRIAVKGYLLRRTVVIKNDKKNKSKKQSNIIKFESLFEETGIQKDSKTARNIKEYCYQVLDYWKGMKFIKDYEKRESKGKGRKSIDAVIIKI